MSLKSKEVDLHKQLLAAFDEYIHWNLRWEEKGFKTSGLRTRKSLRNLMNIAYIRWQEILIRLHEIEVENGTKKAKKYILKEPGLGFIQGLHAAKKKKLKRPDSKNDDNTSR